MRLGIPAVFCSILLTACGGPLEGEDVVEVELVDETTAEADATEAMKADVAGLTAAQAREVLTALDNICGDTWCEGDFSWHFKRMTCNFGLKRCTVTMFIEDGYGEGKTWWRSARISRVSSYRSLMSGGELTDSFYDKVNVAVSRIEEKLAEEL